MGGLKAFKLALQGFVLIANYLHDKKMMDAGAHKLIVESLERASDEVDNAIFAGEHAAIRFDDLGGLPDNTDPNLRD